MNGDREPLTFRGVPIKWDPAVEPGAVLMYRPRNDLSETQAEFLARLLACADGNAVKVVGMPTMIPMSSLEIPEGTPYFWEYKGEKWFVVHVDGLKQEDKLDSWQSADDYDPTHVPMRPLICALAADIWQKTADALTVELQNRHGEIITLTPPDQELVALAHKVGRAAANAKMWRAAGRETPQEKKQ